MGGRGSCIANDLVRWNGETFTFATIASQHPSNLTQSTLGIALARSRAHCWVLQQGGAGGGGGGDAGDAGRDLREVIRSKLLQLGPQRRRLERSLAQERMLQVEVRWRAWVV